MKTTILMTIEHSKPIPDLTDIAANRVWPLDGVTGVTASIMNIDTTLNTIAPHLDPQNVLRPGSFYEVPAPRSFWSWLWRSQA